MYRWSFGLLDRWCSHLPHLSWFKLWKFPLKEKQQQKKIKKNNLTVALKSDASVKTKNAPGRCGGTRRDRSGIPGYWKHGLQPLPLVSQRRLCIWLLFSFFAESLFPTERWLDISDCHQSWVGPGDGGDHSARVKMTKHLKEPCESRPLPGGPSPRLKALKKNRRASRSPRLSLRVQSSSSCTSSRLPLAFLFLFVCLFQNLLVFVYLSSISSTLLLLLHLYVSLHFSVRPVSEHGRHKAIFFMFYFVCFYFYFFSKRNVLGIKRLVPL